jgi:hypothetical protein
MGSDLHPFGFSSSEGSRFGLRWFTPVSEVPLCGHATLASAAVLFHKIRNVDFLYACICACVCIGGFLVLVCCLFVCLFVCFF